jgi:hypothetical protein
MNEKLLYALRFGTPVWSNKLNDWCYVVNIWADGSYFLAPWPLATGTSHNLSDIDLSKEFSVTREV